MIGLNICHRISNIPVNFIKKLDFSMIWVNNNLDPANIAYKTRKINSPNNKASDY